MGRQKFAVLGAVCMTVGVMACSDSPKSPVSPGSDVPVEAAGPNGETLKISAPTVVSPTNGAQLQNALSLVLNNVNGTFAAFPVSYRYEVRTTTGAVVATGLVAASAGATTTIPVSASLDFDREYSWRARAEYNGKIGPWSGNGAFRSAVGGYIRAGEILDPLTKGTTVGQIRGPVTFIDGVGVRMDTNDSYIAYQLPAALQEGEFSFIATNVDEGNRGDKSKVMSMGETLDDDVTDNDYRMTLEVRGSTYPQPGTISYRVITGDAREDAHQIRDSARVQVQWTRSNTYFFKMWWRTGQAGYEIRENSATGPLVDAQTLGTSGRPYRPAPHVVYIGAPPTRAGSLNATHAGVTVRNLWVSASPRPNFP